jgi:hypothetical protein
MFPFAESEQGFCALTCIKRGGRRGTRTLDLSRVKAAL